MTRTGSAMGTAGYMSPEQVRREELDARSDLFSFGLILYEMVTGTHPFQGRTAAELGAAILNEDPAPLPASVPSDLSGMILRLVEKSPADRYQQASEICAALHAAQSFQAVPSVTDRQPHRRVKRTLWRWGAAVAAVLVLAVVMIRYLMPPPLPRVTGSMQLTNGSDPQSGMATDGLRLYFLENRAAIREIAQVAVTGGDPSVLPAAISHPMIRDISPDHTELLVTTSGVVNSPLWVLPLPAGPPRRLGDMDANGASWSPDGKHLVITRNSDVYLAAADGSNAGRIVSGVQGKRVHARFSPDGTRIRFNVTNEQANTITLWEVRANGSGLHQLLPGWRSLDAGFRWTPNGRYFVFGSDAGNGARDIFAVREKGGLFRRKPDQPVRLTFGPLHYAAPIVSLDGKKLFVAAWHQGGELVRYDSASRQFLGGISATDVSFSRDGQWIAWISVPGYELWRSRVDGSEKLQLTASSGNT